jgi:thioredoxin-like negative regulator of GroEL
MGNVLGMVNDNASPTDDDVRLLFVTRRTSGIGRRMESVLATLQARKRDGISIRRVDADAEPELVGQLGVDQIPTLVFVKNRRSVAQICGRATLDEIENVIAAVSAI